MIVVHAQIRRTIFSLHFFIWNFDNTWRFFLVLILARCKSTKCSFTLKLSHSLLVFNLKCSVSDGLHPTIMFLVFKNYLPWSKMSMYNFLYSQTLIKPKRNSISLESWIFLQRFSPLKRNYSNPNRKLKLFYGNSELTYVMSRYVSVWPLRIYLLHLIANVVKVNGLVRNVCTTVGSANLSCVSLCEKF